MPTATLVRRNAYFDSVALMQVARRLEAEPGVETAAALMATPANRELLAAAGLGETDTVGAGPNDLLIAVRAATPEQVEQALELADSLLAPPRVVSGNPVARSIRSIDQATAQHPDANLALIAVPGPFAYLEARDALTHGLNVLIFSDHVPLADEIELKRLGEQRGLLVMGPECGTALIDGVGLGFCNVVRPGRIGIVGASGTGVQHVMALIDRAGEGVSQAIGVGGRDFHQEVGGLGTRLAIRRLARDPSTEVVVVIAKSPAPAIAHAIREEMVTLGRPVVLNFLGVEPAEPSDRVVSVATLEGAARAAVRLARGEPVGAPDDPEEPDRIERLARRLAGQMATSGRDIRGLFSGGSLCEEALFLLRRALGPVGSNVGTAAGEGERPLAGHCLLDLGADEFTRGRPHPMIDPALRLQVLEKTAADPAVGVVLLDLILGRGAHPDPASALGPAIRRARTTARAAGRSLAAVVSVVGAKADPQGLDRQMDLLADAGAVVVTTNAAAARLAARIVANLPGGAA